MKNIDDTTRLSLLKSVIVKIINNQNIIGNITIIDNNNTVYDNLVPNAEISYQITPFSVKAKKSIYPSWGNILMDKHGMGYLEFGQKFRNYKNGQIIGTLILYIKESALCDAYHVSNWGESFLLANNNYIISHFNKKIVGYYIYDNIIFQNNAKFSYRKYMYQGVASIIVSYTINDQLDWKLISYIPEKRLFVVVKQINHTILMVEMPIIAILILLFAGITLQITKPLSTLKRKIDSAELDKVLNLSPFINNDEINALEISYNNLLQRIQELIEKNNLEKERQRELELIALQAQINPHFIYNTLDAIAWLAKLKNQDDIERLVIALATFFRICLHHGDKYILVAEEIALVKSFVSIEQVRFPGKFNVIYDIEQEILAYRMLKIIIQPIVENAIKHGIGRKNGPGEITVTGKRDGDLLRFKVTDDGVGIDLRHNVIDQLPYTIAGGGYGLRNVDERIKLEYGQQYGIEFFSEMGRGTAVTINIKIVADAEETG